VFVYNKKFLLDYEYYKQTGDYMAFISVQALAERNQMTVADVKKVCRHNKVQVNNTVPGVYMIDEDDYMNKLSGGAKAAKKRTLSASHQAKLQAGKKKHAK
tara:strand:- start:239 stop:541 length:303 start_codon:yes stop_codon:yes gene_type:complete